MLLSILSVLNIVCALILFVTAASRINDIAMRQWSVGWLARRAGLLLVAAWALLLLFGFVDPSLASSVLIVGVTLCWLTTPNMVPWWRYVSGLFNHSELHVCEKCSSDDEEHA